VNYCKRYKTVERAFQQEREKLVDHAETGLRYAVINRKDPWAIKFVLRTLGRDRGYTEQQKHVIDGSANVVVSLRWPEEQRSDG
jgi:hypothetical protein